MYKFRRQIKDLGSLYFNTIKNQCERFWQEEILDSNVSNFSSKISQLRQEGWLQSMITTLSWKQNSSKAEHSNIKLYIVIWYVTETNLAEQRIKIREWARLGESNSVQRLMKWSAGSYWRHKVIAKPPKCKQEPAKNA